MLHCTLVRDCRKTAQPCAAPVPLCRLLNFRASNGLWVQNRVPCTSTRDRIQFPVLGTQQRRSRVLRRSPRRFLRRWAATAEKAMFRPTATSAAAPAAAMTRRSRLLGSIAEPCGLLEGRARRGAARRREEGFRAAEWLAGRRETQANGSRGWAGQKQQAEVTKTCEISGDFRADGWIWRCSVLASQQYVTHP
jgi:hypothetical protein